MINPKRVLSKLKVDKKWNMGITNITGGKISIDRNQKLNSCLVLADNFVLDKV